MVFLLVNKNLIRTSKQYFVYVTENCVDELILIIPKVNNNINLESLVPYVELTVPNGIGKVNTSCNSYDYDVLPYKEGYLSITIPIINFITKFDGTVFIKLLFRKEKNDDLPVIFKSDESSFDVIDPTLSPGKHPLPIKPSGGECEHRVYTVEQDDTSDTNTASHTLGVEFNNGDVLVIKDKNGISSGYQYDDDWKVFTGNVNAKNVIFTEDILCAGKYTEVGNVTKGEKETKLLESNGKSLLDIMHSIFTKEEQPTKTNPSLSITLNSAGAYEVGTLFTPKYTTSYNKGSYTYDDDTGVTFSNLRVEDTDGNRSDTTSGTFTSFYVLDNTRYSVSATVNHSDGIIAHTNIGNESKPIVQIKSDVLSKTSSNVTGYRPFFYGILTDLEPITSEIVREKLTNGGNYNASKSFEIKVNGMNNAKRIVVLVPKSSTRGGIKEVMKVDGLKTDITNVYYKQSSIIQVDDLRATGFNFVDYVWWCYQPEKIDMAEIHDIVLN